MRRYRSNPLLPVALAVAVLLGGCWDFYDTDERALVLMLGIDQGDQAPVRVTVQLFIPRGEVQEPTTSGEFRVISREGVTVGDALDEIRGLLYRELELGHTKVVVLGESIARAGLQNQDWLWRTRRLAGTTYLTTTAGPARGMLETPTPPVAIPALFVYHSLRSTHNVSARNLPVYLWQAFSRLEDPLRDLFVPRLATLAQGLRVNGSGVFAGGHLVGWLTPEETASLARALNIRYEGEIAAPTGGRSPMSGHLTGGSSRRGVRRGPDGRLILWVHLRAEAELQDRGGRPLRTAESELSAALAEQCRSMLKHLQGLGSDPLGFGELLRQMYPRHPAVGSAEAWHRAYAAAGLDVRALVRVRTAGFTRR